MLNIEIPGFHTLCLEHLVLDFNGTMASDGQLLAGISPRIQALARELTIHVITGDTHGGAQSQLQGLPLRLTVLDAKHQAEAKLTYIRELGAEHVACIGNGRNDRLMLQEASLGFAVAGTEGASIEAILAANLFVPDIHQALDLLRAPQRLVATLRG